MIPMLVIPAQLIDLFLSADEPDRLEIIRIGSLLLICAALFQLVDATQVVVLGLLRGLQDTRIPMFLAAIAYWLLGLPAAYLFGFVADWKGTGVWLGLVAGLAIAAVLLLIRFWGYVRHLEQDVAQEVAQTLANP
jgi:MATE family multidrug resistance protein